MNVTPRLEASKFIKYQMYDKDIRGTNANSVNLFINALLAYMDSLLTDTKITDQNPDKEYNIHESGIIVRKKLILRKASDNLPETSSISKAQDDEVTEMLKLDLDKPFLGDTTIT